MQKYVLFQLVYFLWEINCKLIETADILWSADRSALKRPVSSLVAQLVTEHEVGADLDPEVQSEDDRQADPIVRVLHV